MGNSTGFQMGRGCAWLAVAGWAIVVVSGIALVWFGFLRPSDDGQSDGAQASATAMVAMVQTLTAPTSTPLPPGIATPTSVATTVPLPSPTAQSATATLPAPATDTPPAATATTPPEPTAEPSITAGSQGVNVRGGPGTNYNTVGHLNPGDQAPVTGKYGGWWQILYNDAAGWVSGEIVTASDTENVPEVEPPPAPTRPPATATSAAPVAPTAPPAAPPTAAPPPASGVRGLVADGYQVEGAPGPYSVGSDIWFNMWISNNSGAPVEFAALGTWIQENGQYQKSWSYSQIPADRQFTHRDHTYSHQIPAPGTYHLFLRICFADGECANLAGPVEIVVQ